MNLLPPSSGHCYTKPSYKGGKRRGVLGMKGAEYLLPIFGGKIGYRDSSVGIATRYGLDGPGIESRWGARFSAPVQSGPGVHPISCTMGLSWRVKRPGRGVDHPPPSSAEVEGRVELYIFSPSGPSWTCSRVNFSFTFTFHIYSGNLQGLLFEFSALLDTTSLWSLKIT
jgi:hypothetical protein